LIVVERLRARQRWRRRQGMSDQRRDGVVVGIIVSSFPRRHCCRRSAHRGRTRESSRDRTLECDDGGGRGWKWWLACPRCPEPRLTLPSCHRAASSQGPSLPRPPQRWSCRSAHRSGPTATAMTTMMTTQVRGRARALVVSGCPKR
jgi:hypothetical protein